MPLYIYVAAFCVASIPLVVWSIARRRHTSTRARRNLGISTGAIGRPVRGVRPASRTREREIERQLPDVLDQLTVIIEAGLGFDAAMVRLASTSDGPVVDELTRVLHDLRLGGRRDAALCRRAERTESGGLRSFAVAMAQAGEQGLPMAAALRAHAAEVREKRRVGAEARARRVPVRILLPLALCVLPTLFVVIVGPVVIHYQDGFG